MVLFEVEAWDTSALSNVFSLVRYVLLDDMNEAYDLLPHVMASGALSNENLSEWPILQELRTDARFKDVAEELVKNAERPDSTGDEHTPRP